MKWIICLLMVFGIASTAYGWERNVVKRFDDKVELKVMRIMASGISHEPWLHCTIYKDRHICKSHNTKRSAIIITDNYWQRSWK